MRKRRRVAFQSWGILPERLRDLVPGSCYVVQGESITDAVARSVERGTRLSVVTMRADGTSLSHGVPEARIYALTLGTPLPRKVGGGYSVEGSLLVSVPVEAWTEEARP